jgi:hypothetical protein
VITMAAETGTFTVGVFQNLEWAARGVEALKRHRFTPESLSVIAKEAPGVAELCEEGTGQKPDAREWPRLGSVCAAGPLVAALAGPEQELSQHGIAGSIRRVGFQSHDGVIYERLVERGGILVAIHHEPRAADALAVLHAFGAGNAAIGAWAGRL